MFILNNRFVSNRIKKFRIDFFQIALINFSLCKFLIKLHGLFNKNVHVWLSISYASTKCIRRQRFNNIDTHTTFDRTKKLFTTKTWKMSYTKILLDASYSQKNKLISVTDNNSISSNEWSISCGKCF